MALGGVTFRFVQAGLDEVLRGPNGPVVRDIARRTLAVDGAAKRGCPVDTGRLRSSIQNTVQLEGSDVVGYVGSDVSYAIFVHEGTRYMAPRPFLVDALPAAGA